MQSFVLIEFPTLFRYSVRKVQKNFSQVRPRVEDMVTPTCTLDAIRYYAILNYTIKLFLSRYMASATISERAQWPET